MKDDLKKIKKWKMTPPKMKIEDDLKKIEDNLKKINWRQTQSQFKKTTLIGCDIIVN